MIEAQRVKNKDVIETYDQSIDLYKRLCNIVNMQTMQSVTLGEDSMNIDRASEPSI
jgi:hypothetical protein